MCSRLQVAFTIAQNQKNTQSNQHSLTIEHTQMKIPLITTLLALQMGVVETNKLRGASERHLVTTLPDYYFLVSQIRKDEDWCLTAVEGTKEFGNLGFKRCDFDKTNENQVWKRVRDGKFHSKQDFDLCMVVGYGKTIFDGVRMRLADCDLDLTMFSYDGDFIKPMEGTDFCVTNRGPNPDSSDTIHSKPCIDRADYKWTLKEATVYEENPSKKQTIPSGLCDDHDCPDDITCPEDSSGSCSGVSCDPAVGGDECKHNSELRPCIAIFDESDYFSDTEIDAKWAEFRAKWPDRPFCLLQPLIPNPGPRYLHIPDAFYDDPKTVFRVVNRDEGDEDKASDWYEICELDVAAKAGMDFVRWELDGSFDSMDYYETVPASQEMFYKRLEKAGMAHVGGSRFWEKEDWISWCTAND